MPRLEACRTPGRQRSAEFSTAAQARSVLPAFAAGCSYILCRWYVAGKRRCVHPIKMSSFLPNTDVTGSGGGRARSPRRSAAPDRRSRYGYSKPPPMFLPSGLGRSARRSADFKQTRVALIAPARGFGGQAADREDPKSNAWS